MVHNDCDNCTLQHRRQTLTREVMAGRYISHIPAKLYEMAVLLRLFAQL